VSPRHLPASQKIQRVGAIKTSLGWFTAWANLCSFIKTWSRALWIKTALGQWRCCCCCCCCCCFCCSCVVFIFNDH